MRAMGTVTIKIPLVTWRDGRPRFIPGPSTTALGYKGQDLRHPPIDRQGRPAGAWFSLEECIAWSKARQAEIEDKRRQVAAGAKPQKIRRQLAAARAEKLATVEQMLAAFFDQPRLKGETFVKGRKKRPPLAENTIRYYKQGRAVLERFDDGFVLQLAAASVKPAGLAELLGKIEENFGLAQTRCVRALLSTAFTFGVKRSYVLGNPVEAMEDTLPELAPRVRYGTIAEMEHLVKVADALGFPDIGDSIELGLNTGQRQGDRLALEDGRVTPDGILFRQGKKHGQPLLIPMTPILQDRLEAARRRRQDWRVNYPHVLLCEALKAPWDENWYRKHFRVIRIAAATGDLERDKEGKPTQTAKSIFGERNVPLLLAAAGLKPMPSLGDFRDQDLRDTAVTWLALAEADKFGISSITGHSLKSIDTILSHYLGLHPELARTAIGKLVKWRGKGQGG